MVNQQKYPYQPVRMRHTHIIKSRKSTLRSVFWHYALTGIKSYAVPEAVVVQTGSRFPIIIYSPGIGSDAYSNVYLEELASQGYVIVAVYHPYDMEPIVFPDGRSLSLDPDFRSMIDRNDREKIYEYRTRAHADWLQDQQYVLDKLSEWNGNQRSHFYNKLDLQRIGALGHSHGGAVVLDLCKTDIRVKACIDMDGWTKTANTAAPFAKPVLLLLNQDGLDQVDTFVKNMGDYISVIKVAGAGHGAFSDNILLKWPFVRIFGVATHSADVIRKDISRRIVEFFNKNLLHDGPCAQKR